MVEGQREEEEVLETEDEGMGGEKKGRKRGRRKSLRKRLSFLSLGGRNSSSTVVGGTGRESRASSWGRGSVMS